ncbi:MAG: hypothetical protein WCT39_02030 [Candidatus Margulisiibacteriota bacterium]
MAINNISGNNGLRSQESGAFSSSNDPLKGLEDRVQQTLTMIAGTSTTEQPSSQMALPDSKVSFTPDILAQTFGQDLPGQNIYSLC